MSSGSDSLDFGPTLRGLMPQQRVFGRYTLLQVRGRGGMGVVWAARDDELQQDVALKFLPDSVATDKAALDDLRRETRRSRELTHPHIVRIHDFIRDERSAAISMELVEGDTLSSLRVDRPNKVFEPEELREWVRQLCEALTYAHEEARVVHRDLKPANLMIDARGRLKITDFGISGSVADSVSRVSNVVGSTSGTPVYMSPQQMMGEKPSVADDIYSLGATLYELLTGKPPFYSGRIEMQVMQKAAPSIANRRVEFGVKGDPIPQAWERAVAACLSKDAGDRPLNVDAVQAILGGVSPSMCAVAAEGSTNAVPVDTSTGLSEQSEGVRNTGSTTSQQTRAPNLSDKLERAASLFWLAATVVVLGGFGYYLGVYKPEQRRLDAERQRSEQQRIATEVKKIESQRLEQRRVESQQEEQRRIAERKTAGARPVVVGDGGLSGGPRDAENQLRLGEHLYHLQLRDKTKSVRSSGRPLDGTWVLDTKVVSADNREQYFFVNYRISQSGMTINEGTAEETAFHVVSAETASPGEESTVNNWGEKKLLELRDAYLRGYAIALKINGMEEKFINLPADNPFGPGRVFIRLSRAEFKFVDSRLKDGTTQRRYGINGPGYLLVPAVEAEQAASSMRGVANIAIEKQTEALTRDMMAYYTFDESDAKDSSRSGQHGKPNSGVTFVAGMHGRSARFDGMRGSIEIPRFRALSTNARSISLWIKQDVIQRRTQDIVSHHSSPEDIDCLIRSADDGRYDFLWRIGGRNFDGSAGPNVVDDSRGLVEPTAGQWEFVLLTYDGTDIRFYFNGKIVRSLSAGGNIAECGLPWRLGAYAFDGTNPFRGALDEVRIYGRALSEGEVQTLYSDIR